MSSEADRFRKRLAKIKMLVVSLLGAAGVMFVALAFAIADLF